MTQTEPSPNAGRFEPARVQLEGHCGCGWNVTEVNPPPANDLAVAQRVQAAVIQHAAEQGHAPTYVEIREHFWRPPVQMAAVPPVPAQPTIVNPSSGAITPPVVEPPAPAPTVQQAVQALAGQPVTEGHPGLADAPGTPGPVADAPITEGLDPTTLAALGITPAG